MEKNVECGHPRCKRGPKTGHTIFQVSGKGPRCAEHLTGDPAKSVSEKRNKSAKLANQRGSVSTPFLVLLVCALALVPLLMGPVGNPPGAPKPILCTTACDVSAIRVGQTAIVRKTAATNRASTTVQALDPDLQFTSLPAGVYEFVAELTFSGAGGGIGFGLTSTATLVGGSGSNDVAGFYWGYRGGPGACSTAGSPENTGWFSPAIAFHSCATTLSTGWGTFQSVTLRTSTSGTAGVNWAQQTSNAGNTAMKAGSYMRVTRIN